MFFLTTNHSFYSSWSTTYSTFGNQRSNSHGLKMAGGLPGLGIMVPTWLVGKFTIELDAFRTFGNSMFWGFPSHVWNLKCFANLVRFSHVFLGGSMKGDFFISIKNRAIYLYEWELHIFISWRWWAKSGSRWSRLFRAVTKVYRSPCRNWKLNRFFSVGFKPWLKTSKFCQVKIMFF